MPGGLTGGGGIGGFRIDRYISSRIGSATAVFDSFKTQKVLLKCFGGVHGVCYAS